MNNLQRLCIVAFAVLVASADGYAQTNVTVDAGRGPVTVYLPSAFDGTTELPLVLNLHGYTGSGASQQDYFGLVPQADQRGFMIAIPDGMQDSSSLRYWNATDACCDFDGTNPDDSAYLRNLIEVIAAAFPTDDRRVYAMGHSNGGFMSHRLACDHADRIAGIVSFAGAQWEDASLCDPSEPVSVVQLHGVVDFTIQYGGGCIPGLGCYPSARTTANTWAGFNGCDVQPRLVFPLLDLMERREGRDTIRQSFTGCSDASVELWSSPGVGHVPSFTPAFAAEVMDFLLSNPKPAR